jgi:hypothetical protein
MRLANFRQPLSLTLALTLICSQPAYSQDQASSAAASSSAQKSDSSASKNSDSDKSSTTTTSTFIGPLSDYVPCMFHDEDEFAMRAQDLPEQVLDKRHANQMFDAAKVFIYSELSKQANLSAEDRKAIEDYFSTNLYGDWLVGNTPDEASNRIQAVVLDALSHGPSEATRKQASAKIKAEVENAVRSTPSLSTLSGQDLAAAGKDAINDVGKSNSFSDSYLTDVVNRFSQTVTRAKFPQNADSLATAASDAAKQAKGQPVSGQQLSTQEQTKQKLTNASLLSEAVRKAVSGKIEAHDAEARNLPENKIAAGDAAIAQVAKDSKYEDEYRAKVSTSFREAVKDFTAASTSVDFGNAAEKAALTTNIDPTSEEATTSINVIDDLKKTLSQYTPSANNKPQSAKKYQPPDDISCSIAILTWKETRDIFGRRVANTYVAIQVNLRNLNTKNEFLVHDIQVAVDTGMDANHFGRFQSGRDKLLVRAVAQKGQTDDRRNITLNVLQSIGAIASASSLIAGTAEFKSAVAVFQGAFITGFSNIFPDHTVDHLNHINDMVFSASNTSKVVVPVQGSVPLVTFISEKPIEELPFAWCGYPRHKWMDFYNIGREQNCDFNGGKHDPGYVTPYRYSGRQLEPETKSKDHSYPLGPSVATPQDSNNNDTAFQDGLPPWKDLAFRDWRGAAIRMLQEHTFVVMSGVHIQEVVTQPRLASLSCANQLKGGQLDLSKTNNGNVECTVSGSGLNLVTGVDIEKADSKISGTFKVGTDNSSATIQFKPDDKLCVADGTYSLFVTYKSDTQKDASPLDTGNKLQLISQPVLSGTQTLSGKQLALNGYCLDKLDSVTLTNSTNSNTTVAMTLDKPTGNSNTTTRTATSSSDIAGSSTYNISYKISGLNDNVTPSPAITVSSGGTQ